MCLASPVSIEVRAPIVQPPRQCAPASPIKDDRRCPHWPTHTMETVAVAARRPQSTRFHHHISPTRICRSRRFTRVLAIKGWGNIGRQFERLVRGEPPLRPMSHKRRGAGVPPTADQLQTRAECCKDANESGRTACLHFSESPKNLLRQVSGKRYLASRRARRLPTALQCARRSPRVTRALICPTLRAKKVWLVRFPAIAQTGAVWSRRDFVSPFPGARGA